MQNHPHDSICGCSVDDVHREMVTRFEKSEQVALHIISMCMDYLKGKINTSAVKETFHLSWSIRPAGTAQVLWSWS